MYLITVDRLPL
ncbi:unnamed protein product, partial [Rotaria sp. Silwood1]